MPAPQRASTRTVLLFALLFAAITGSIFVVRRFPLGPDVRAFLGTPFFHLGNLAVDSALLIEAFVFLILLALFSRLVRTFLRTEVLRRTDLDEGQRYAIERTVGYAVFAVGMLVGMQIFGLDVSSLAFLGGAVGIGVGFGLQNITSNFASGLILLLERPIKVGDRIEVGTLNGDVVRIGGRSTWVRTDDNLIIIVPNSEFTTNRVTYWAANDRKMRFSLPVGVAYGSDPEKVRAVLLDIAAQHPDVLKEPEAEVLLASFGDSSINFDLRVWTTNQVQNAGQAEERPVLRDRSPVCRAQHLDSLSSARRVH